MLGLPLEVHRRMPSNAVIALDSNFKLWTDKRFPDPAKRKNVFEYYCIEQFARSFDLSDSELRAGMVGGPKDGGVDAFYVLANGEAIDSEFEIDPKDPPDFKILIIQSKSDEGFSPVAVDKLYWFLDDLLDLSRKKADYHSTYHDDLVSLMRVFKDKLGVVVGETPALSIECVYVIKKDVEPNADCEKSALKVKTRILHYFNHAEAVFKFVNAAGLWKQVQARPPKQKTLRWSSQPMSTEEGEIGLVRLIDFYDFIRGTDNKIEERFFDSNVRSYWPTSTINKTISETLKQTTAPEFWLLNNGVTILTDKTVAGAKHLEIEIYDPQIVNGLQTSRTAFGHFAAVKPNTDDKRRLLVRVIKSTDTDTRDAVIRCTNSQNEMPPEALRATDPIHRQIETAFHTKKLYYDRRKGYYKDQGKPPSDIVSVIEVLQAMLAVVLQRPDDARGRPRDYIKDTTKYKSIFGEDQYTITLYLTATEIVRRVGDLLDSKAEKEALESIHRRNINFGSSGKFVGDPGVRT
jgi:hypothetical protein